MDGNYNIYDWDRAGRIAQMYESVCMRVNVSHHLTLSQSPLSFRKHGFKPYGTNNFPFE